MTPEPAFIQNEMCNPDETSNRVCFFVRALLGRDWTWAMPMVALVRASRERVRPISPLLRPLCHDIRGARAVAEADALP